MEPYITGVNEDPPYFNNDDKSESNHINNKNGCGNTKSDNYNYDDPERPDDYLVMTCSSPRCPLLSHSLVCSKNHLFIVGIGPICDKEISFIFRSN